MAKSGFELKVAKMTNLSFKTFLKLSVFVFFAQRIIYWGGERRNTINSIKFSQQFTFRER